MPSRLKSYGFGDGSGLELQSDLRIQQKQELPDAQDYPMPNGSSDAGLFGQETGPRIRQEWGKPHAHVERTKATEVLSESEPFCTVLSSTPAVSGRFQRERCSRELYGDHGS